MTAIFKRIDQHPGEWIEKETWLLVTANSKDEELSVIIVGGDIMSDEQISGKGRRDSLYPGSKQELEGTSLKLDRTRDTGLTLLL